MITALSLRQPWAWAVLNLGKHIENRRWDTQFRGDFLIHASKGMTKQEYYDCLDFCRDVVGTSAISHFPPLAALQRGGIVGAACLARVMPPCAGKCWESGKGGACGVEHGWHMPDQFGFVLERVRPSPRFVECKGMLGFFQVGDQVARSLRGAS